MPSIFDEASKKSTPAPEEKSSERKPLPKKVPLPDKKAGDEIEVMLNKMKVMRQDLENKLATIREDARTHNINLEKYFGNTYELTKQEIEKIQEQEKLLTDKIAVALPPESCLRKKPKSKEALTKERKGKLRGARNKWIPMK